MSTASRKLTTVFSADVQGYSRLMEVDEEGTFATLKVYRDAMARLIASHGGRVVNTWGDGVIAEFASVVAAVRAAVDVQNELAEHNAGRPDEARMLFRIGINLGDVIVDGDDIYGDGVNIAARLQEAAQPGGILISSTVHDQVRNKLAVGFEFLGNLSVKNIDESVPSYSVRIGDQQGAATASQRAPASQFASGEVSVGGFRIRRRIAVLGLLGVGFVAINLASSPDTFWARWPLLVLAMIAGLDWARQTNRFNRAFASLAVVGLGLVAINLLSWSGQFWAVWPLMVIALVATARWLMRRA